MINPNEHNPTTLEEAVDLVYNSMTLADATFIYQTGAESMHHGYGTAMRNAWLWNEEHPLHIHMKKRFGLGHADDMSGLILRGVDCRMRNKPHNVFEQVREYKEHWARENIDPLTLDYIDGKDHTVTIDPQEFKIFKDGILRTLMFWRK